MNAIPLSGNRQARRQLTIATKTKTTDAAEKPVAILVSPSVPLVFPVCRLRRAAENVRHTRVDEGCEELADDIQAHGLLQSLIGYMDGQHVEVVGGGRRLKALRIVRSRGLIDDDFPVPVLIRDADEAIELSLAENLQQRTMSPVDEFLAFQKLMEGGGTSPAELAKRFGWTERLVKQRLRLADLARPVLDALAEREITLDAAMAYATSQDKSLQADVFGVQAKRGRTAHDPSGVRHALRMKGIDTGDRLFKFVGAERYEREGGDYEDDLFNEAGTERVLAKPFLLETLANTMADFQATRLVDALRSDDRWSPAIAGFVKVSDLRLHSYGTIEKPRPPAGFVLVERAESERLWRTIRNNGFTVHVLVGIDVVGELIADPRYAFVPIAQKTAVEKPALIDTAEDSERSTASERERRIIHWSRRLAVPPFAGTPFEGRVFWPPIGEDRVRAETIDGAPGYLVPVFVFVTQDQVAAARKEAVAKVDAERAGEGAAFLPESTKSEEAA